MSQAIGRTRPALWAFLCILSAFVGVALVAASPDEPLTLAGEWLVQMPAGFEQPQTITHLDGDRYLLGRLNHAGVYRLEGDRLIMDEPRDRRLTEFVWRLRADGTLILIAEPPPAKTGASYLGMVMRPAAMGTGPAPPPPASPPAAAGRQGFARNPTFGTSGGF
jgi:hypothetical protein